jgi:hypothetical protein
MSIKLKKLTIFIRNISMLAQSKCAINVNFNPDCGIE